MTVEELINKYSCSARYTSLSLSSKGTYAYALELIKKAFGKTPAKDIKRSDIIKLQTELDDRPGTSNLVVRVASIVFEYGVDLDAVPFNPAARLKKLKTGSHLKWEPHEVAKAIAECDRKVGTAIVLAWYTGQRECDVLNMRWCDISEGYISLTQRKTGLEMKIKMHPDLISYLDSIRGDEPDTHYIVSGETRMNGPAFRNMFRRRMDRMGSTKVFHGIRKGVASSIAEKGASINEIAAIMGHKSLRMAAYYAEQASRKTLRESAVDLLVSCVD